MYKHNDLKLEFLFNLNWDLSEESPKNTTHLVPAVVTDILIFDPQHF